MNPIELYLLQNKSEVFDYLFTRSNHNDSIYYRLKRLYPEHFNADTRVIRTNLTTYHYREGGTTHIAELRNYVFNDPYNGVEICMPFCYLPQLDILFVHERVGTFERAETALTDAAGDGEGGRA